MCDCNLESPAWDWMCADVCKAVRGRDSDKITLSLTSLVVGSMCVVFSRISAISPGYKAFWCPEAVLCKPWEDVFLMHLFMVVTGISYFCRTYGQQLFSF